MKREADGGGRGQEDPGDRGYDGPRSVLSSRQRELRISDVVPRTSPSLSVPLYIFYRSPSPMLVPKLFSHFLRSSPFRTFASLSLPLRPFLSLFVSFRPLSHLSSRISLGFSLAPSASRCVPSSFSLALGSLSPSVLGVPSVLEPDGPIVPARG